MRISTDFLSRWATVFLALTFLAVALAACSDSSSGDQGESEADQESAVRMVAPPTEAVGAPTGTTIHTARAVPVVANEKSTDPDRLPGPASQTDPAATPAPTPLEGSGLPADTGAAANLMLAAFEEVLTGIYEGVVPSVVYIRVPNPAASSLQGIQGVPDELLWSAGSGFVWDAEGHIITNYHVVENVIGSPDEVTVIFADSTQAKGTVVGGDPHSDLAVIKLAEGDWDLQPVILGDSGIVKVGQLTVAIGAPFGQEFTMTSGIVSAVGRNISSQSQFTIPEVIQTDSAINPGNSGGPLLDRLGQVIGINTQIISRSGSFSGVGLAVPVNIAKRVVPSLISEGEFSYPWLGVNIATVNNIYVDKLNLPNGTKGVLIIATVGDSPADRAGLSGSDSTVDIDGVPYPAGGDIIVGLGSHQITSSSGLIAHLAYHNSPGDVVTLVVLRDGQREEVEVTLGRRPAAP